jgi:chitodextrinase
LYFSTDGIDGGIGRKDIYYSDNINGEWQPPVNLGEPINSRRDDYSLEIDDDLRTGYYTSDRDRSPDIFYFESTLPVLDECKEVEENRYCFTFFDEGAATLDTTTLNYEWDMGDGTKIVGLEAEHCFKGPGNYEVKLNVIDALTGETYFNEATYDFPLEDIEQAYITCPDTVKVNEEVTFNGSNSNIKEFSIEQYIWDFGDLNQAVGENVSHVYKVPGQFTLKLGVTNGAGNPDEILKKCSYKIITVLP